VSSVIQQLGYRAVDRLASHWTACVHTDHQRRLS